MNYSLNVGAVSKIDSRVTYDNSEDGIGRETLAMLPLSSAIRLRLPKETGGPGEDVATKLARALVTCEEGVVRECLQQGVDPDLVLPGGHTPVTFLVTTATSDRWEDLVRLLLEAGASPHSRDPRGLPLLSLLTIAGSVDLVQLALDKGADVKVLGANDETPLLNAVHYRQVECLRLLLQRGADPNTVAWDGNSALMWAAGRSNGLGMQRSLACVRILLQYGAQANFRNPRGFTPLMAASLIRERQTVRTLLAAGADPDMRDARGETALIKATDADAEHVISELLASKANVNIQSRSGCTALMSAVSREVLGKLLHYHADPTIVAHDGTTALHLQAMGGRAELALSLLEYGADLEVRDSQGNSPLQTAVRCRSHAVSHHLLASGANATSVNDMGVSVLHDAVFPWDYYNSHNIFSALSIPTIMAEFLYYFRSGSSEMLGVVERLLERGADPGLAGEGGVTPLMLAAACGDERFLRLLLEAGASASARDAEGRTALAYCCKWGHSRLVHLLLAYDSPVNTLDAHYNLPIYYAARHAHTTILMTLMVELAFYVCNAIGHQSRSQGPY